MIRPDEDALRAFAALTRGHPAMREFLAAWLQHELTQLPFVAPASVGIAQGRCQVLTELHKLLQGHTHPAAQPQVR